MMETNLPDSGFLTCFYYTGRHTTDFACDARDENQIGRASCRERV